jgi:quercetin dioxygenase-like cupin family protein
VYREGRLIEDVEGDRNKQGASHVIRIINDDGTIVLPHRHPEDEHITVIQGTWYLGVGERFDRGALEEMTIGAYARVPRGMAHFAWSRGETIIQVHGIGPFRTDFFEPVIFLSEPNNQPHFKYKLGQRVLSQKGPGVIGNGGACVKQRLVQYQIRRDEGGPFVALEEDLTPIR